ncbi:outer membrane protein assembly factor BamD [bacterium]|nr:outer membrane protein assembly factor BamD [bacterium]
MSTKNIFLLIMFACFLTSPLTSHTLATKSSDKNKTQTKAKKRKNKYQKAKEKQQVSKKVIKKPKWKKLANLPEVLRKSYKSLSDTELDEAILLYKQQKNLRMVARCLERKTSICSDTQKLKNLKLKLANTYFEKEDLEKAGTLYTEFALLYPGSTDTEEVEYRAILCHVYRLPDHDRDQSVTRQAILLAENFLQRKKLYKKYTADVAKILKHCLEKLFDNEVEIFKFHANKKNLKAAEKRLDSIVKQFEKRLENTKEKIEELRYILAKNKDPKKYKRPKNAPGPLANYIKWVKTERKEENKKALTFKKQYENLRDKSSNDILDITSPGKQKTKRRKKIDYVSKF